MPLSYEYIKAFNFYQKSILPHNKGWLEESEKFLEAMTIIENTQIKINNELMRKK